MVEKEKLLTCAAGWVGIAVGETPHLRCRSSFRIHFDAIAGDSRTAPQPPIPTQTRQNTHTGAIEYSKKKTKTQGEDEEARTGQPADRLIKL